MKLSTSTILQLINIGVYAVEWYAPFVPSDWMKYFTPVHALALAFLHWKAGQANPDGTPASASYQKPQ